MVLTRLLAAEWSQARQKWEQFSWKRYFNCGFNIKILKWSFLHGKRMLVSTLNYLRTPKLLGGLFEDVQSWQQRLKFLASLKHVLRGSFLKFWCDNTLCTAFLNMLLWPYDANASTVVTNVTHNMMCWWCKKQISCTGVLKELSRLETNIYSLKLCGC
jgi:hypothetical protein